MEQEQYRERSRSPSNDGYNRDRRHNHGANHEENLSENFTLYITNLQFETTDEKLRALFERVGDIQSASIVREPITKNSRGFAFVTMARVEDSLRALSELNGAEIDGRSIKVERARRNVGYEKTPGVYLGPPQLSAKFKNRRDDRDRRDRDDRRGDYRRPDPRDQPRDYRDSREYYDSRDYRPITYRAPVASYDRVPAYRDDRYIDNRGEDMYRRDPRHEVRAPPVAQPVYDTRRSPPRTAEYRSRSPVVAGDRNRTSYRERSRSRH